MPFVLQFNCIKLSQFLPSTLVHSPVFVELSEDGACGRTNALVIEMPMFPRYLVWQRQTPS
jgi:hypothetical protein